MSLTWSCLYCPRRAEVFARHLFAFIFIFQHREYCSVIDLVYLTPPFWFLFFLMIENLNSVNPYFIVVYFFLTKSKIPQFCIHIAAVAFTVLTQFKSSFIILLLLVGSCSSQYYCAIVRSCWPRFCSFWASCWDPAELQLCWRYLRYFWNIAT